MKKVILAGMVAAALVVAPRAEAGTFITLTVGGNSITCDNGTAAGVTNCTNLGFFTTLNDDDIAFGGIFGTFAFQGYEFRGTSGVDSNVPGEPTSANITDTKLTLVNVSAQLPIEVTFGAYGFTLPTGPNLFLSGSQTANWTISDDPSTQAFQVWARADNGTSTVGATATTSTPNCLSNPADPTTFSCSQTSPNVPFLRGAGAFSLIGRETITLGIGDQGTFSGTINVLNTPIPEPGSMMLLGGGLVALAAAVRRRRKA